MIHVDRLIVHFVISLLSLPLPLPLSLSLSFVVTNSTLDALTKVPMQRARQNKQQPCCSSYTQKMSWILICRHCQFKNILCDTIEYNTHNSSALSRLFREMNETKQKRINSKSFIGRTKISQFVCKKLQRVIGGRKKLQPQP